MTSRQKRISWIVAGVLVQGLVIFGTIYFMEHQVVHMLPERPFPVVPGDNRASRDLPSDALVRESEAHVLTPELLAPRLSPKVRELIKIERGSATDIAKTIRELFGERAKVSAVESSSSVVVMSDPETLAEIVKFVEEIAGRSRELEASQLSRTFNVEESRPEPIRTNANPRPSVRVESNSETSDPFAARPEAIPQGNMLKYFTIRSGSPESIATAVKEVFGASVKVTPENGSQSVIVVADPQTQEQVSSFIAQIEERAEEQIAERRKLAELREKQQAEERRRSTKESLKQFERSQPQVVRTQPPPQTDERSEGPPHNPFEPQNPQQEDFSSTSKFPADAQDTELDRNAKQLALRIRAAKPDEQANLRKELENITVRQFQHRQQRRQQEFESLSQRLERLKASHQRRQKHQAEVVERRIKELLDPNADLRWEEQELSDERPADVASSSPVGENEAALTRESVVLRIEPAGTYNGVTLSEWLRLLEVERNQDKIGEALIAMNHLMDQADPRELTRIILRTMRIYGAQNITGGMGGMPNSSAGIVVGSMHLLTRLPSDIVVEEISSELDSSASLRPTQDFLCWFLYSIEAKTVSRELYWKGANGNTYGFLTPDRLASQESIKRLESEIRRRSRTLISQLVAIAKRDENLTNWSVRCAEKIIRISNQLLTTYPDLIPLVDRLFDRPVTELPSNQSNSPFYQGPVAAVLLGESGLRIPEILAFAAEQLKHGYSPMVTQGPFAPVTSHTPTHFEVGLRCLIAVAPHSPDAVGLLTGMLDRNWKAISDLLNELDVYSKRPQDSTLAEPDVAGLRKLLEETSLVLDTLAEIGVPASPSIEALTAIANSPKTRHLDLPQRPGVAEPGPNQTVVHRNRTLVDIANQSIQRIKEAKPKPKPEPLPDGDFAKPENVSATRISAPNGKPQKSEPTPPSRPIDETTYDGITYTQWLKLLETERKLDKVIAAIDTCTRLAVKGDERRVAKAVFVAEALFESEGDLKTEAWNTGQTGLARLPTDIVIDELLLALRNSESFKAGRQFQYQFLIEFEHFRNRDREAQIEILRSHSTEIVQELVRQIPAEPDADSLPAIAAASQVCNLANRSINDFDGLTERMIKVVTEVPADEKKIRFYLWMIVAKTLTQQAPDTPDLATILVKQAEKQAPASYPIVELLGKLGARAESAVPALVQLFLVELEKFETTLVPRASPSSPSPLSSEEGRRNFENSSRLRIQIIRTLGEIGKGQMGFDLVWELKKIVPTGLGPGSVDRTRRPGYQDPTKELTTEAEFACSKFEGVKHSGAQLLSDIWSMNGSWAEKSAFTPAGAANSSYDKFKIRGNWLAWNGALRDSSPLSKLMNQLDPGRFSRRPIIIELNKGTASPKKLKLRLVQADASLEDEALKFVEGLYELSDTTLKLQLAPPGLPAPEAFCSGEDSLPEGNILVELQRVAPVPSN